MHDLHQSVIRILNGQSQTLGAGFVISDYLAVTCAHVVQAVGSDAGQTVHIQFCANDCQQTASVLSAGWSPPNTDDLAFLQLDHLPQGIKPVVLGSAGKCNEHSYLSFGFAKIAGYDNRWATGTLDGVIYVPDKHKQPMLQLKGDEIKGGMSGAPVLDTQTDRVVGMVSEYGYDRDADNDYSRRIAWATTSDTLHCLASAILADHPTLRLWPVAYGPVELQTYLQHLIASNEKLFLPDGRDVLLERIYVSLRADEMNAAERQAEHDLHLEDVEALKKLDQNADEDHYAKFDAMHTAIIRKPRMDLLQARDRPRLFGEREHRLLNLAEVEKRHRFVVVLGDPGSGKTTLGKWLVLQFARALLEGRTFVQVRADLVQPGAGTDKPIDLGPARLPLLIRIADYARVRWEERVDNLSLENFISFHWNSNDLPVDLPPEAVHALVKDYLIQGQALVVLDGLDEVSKPNQRRAIMQTVKSFIQVQPAVPKNNEWAGNRLLLTSRIVGYQFDPLTDLPHYTVEYMDEIAISAFCRAWMAHVAGVEEAEEQGRKLKDAIFDHSHPGVRTLAGNPLLLTILAQVYWSSTSRSLPTRRVSLFDEAVKALYNQREDLWESANISLRRLTQALGAVAAHIHAFERTGFAEGGMVREQLKKVLSDEDQVETVLHAARQVSGFLVERGEGVYGFLHRAVQEYFAASHLVNDPSRVSAHIAERLLEPTWREPITLAIGMVSQPRYPNSLRHLAETFDTLLHTADPAGDFLPRRELLAVAACIECERLPPQVGWHIAQRLLALYAHREGGRRSPVLRKRILDAFITLRQNETSIQAEAALRNALLSSDFELRYASIDVIIETKWDSTAVAQALVNAWSQYADPAVSLLTALDEMFKRSPACFQEKFLPLRQILAANRVLWEKASINLQWQAIFRLLYLPLGAYFKVDRINRDSPLTPHLVELLQTPTNPFHPSVFEELCRRLVPLASQPGSALARDAALVLSVLGDDSWISMCVKNADSHGRQIHPIVACLVLALSLVELTLDSNQNNNQVLANDLNHALNLAHSFTQSWNEFSASAQFLQKTRTRIREIEPLVAEGLAQVSAYVADLISEPALANTYTYKLATVLQRDLERICEQIQQHARFSSIAFDPDFNTKIRQINKLCRSLEIIGDLRFDIDNNINTNRVSKKGISEMELQLSNECVHANKLASDLGISLPLDIKQTRLQSTLFIRHIRIIRHTQMKPQAVQKLYQALANRDNLDPAELKEVARNLATFLGPALPLDKQELRALTSSLSRLTAHSLKDRTASKDSNNPVLSIDLANPALHELTKSFLSNLTRLESFIANYADITVRNGNGHADALPAKADAYSEKITHLIPEINSAAHTLDILLPIDWERACNLVFAKSRSPRIADELLTTLDTISDLKQLHIRELEHSHTAADYDQETQGLERVKVLDNQLAQANERVRTLAASLSPGLIALDISRGLEHVRKLESHLSHSHAQALRRVRDLEIEYARTLTRILGQWEDFELAVSQELPDKRSTAKLSLSRGFSRAQEIIQLRTQAREENDKISYLRDLAQKKASDFSLALKTVEEHACQLPQQFELALLRSDTELSSQIDLAMVRHLDLTPDLDSAFGLARHIANVNELLRSIRVSQNNVVNDTEVKQHLKNAFNSANNVLQYLTTSTPIARMMNMLIDTYMNRWPREARSSDTPLEAVQLRSDTIADLVDDLSSANDERRERAKKSLVAKHQASDLGQEAIEQIAKLTDRYAQEPQIATQLIWTLEAIIHDRPSWLAAWIEQRASASCQKEVQIVLDSVHYVTAKACKTMLDVLQDPASQVKKFLLPSLSWMVRLNHIPRGRLPKLQDKLFVWLADEKDPDIRSNIIEILGHWREDSDEVGLKLFARLNQWTTKSELRALYKALARQAVQRPNITEKVWQRLQDVFCSHIEAASALIRLCVAKNEGTTNLQKQKGLDTILNTLSRIPSESRIPSDRPHCLEALLEAGVDDDIWDAKYHGVLVDVTRARLELQINQSPDQNFLAYLLAQFEETLLSRNWPRRRFILAVVAACTEVMPIAVQHAYHGNLEKLLVDATIDAESFNSRRFALTALSYLRTVTPAIIPALLAGCHDTEDVQQDTITAASHFQSIEGNLLPVLMEQISGESVTRAYTVARLLNALSGSAASEASDLCNQIIEAVVEALKNEGSQREVFIAGESKGKLEDVLYTTLLRVAGWMG